jgi:hypothetical protein
LTEAPVGYFLEYEIPNTTADVGAANVFVTRDSEAFTCRERCLGAE